MLNELRDAWQHRDLMKDLAARELRVRYLGSLMGKYWNIIHPLIVISIYTLIFSQLLGVRSHQTETSSGWTYAAFLCAGLIPWNFFTELMLKATNSFAEYSHLIRKIRFPLLVIPCSLAMSASVSFLISVLIYLVFLALIGQTFSNHIFLLPVIFLIQIVFTLGLALVTSVLNTFFRDVQQVLGVGLQLLFWGTPIIYSMNQVPTKYAWILELNPMTHCVGLYRSAFLGLPIDFRSLAIFTVTALVWFFLGLYAVSSAKAEILDQV